MRLGKASARATHLVAAAGLGLTAALATGCSSSSSPNHTAATSATTPGVTASTGVSGSPGSSPGVSGIGASVTPTGSPPPPLTFHGVSHGAWLWIQRIGNNSAYVAQVTYNARSHTVQASFKPGTTATDLRNFKSLVRQAERLAAQGKEPSTSTPTPGHGVKHHRRVHHHRNRQPTPTSSAPRSTPLPTPKHHHGPPPHASSSPSPTPSSTATH